MTNIKFTKVVTSLSQVIYISDGPSLQKRFCTFDSQRTIANVPRVPSKKQIVGVLEYNLPVMSVVEAYLKLYEVLLCWMRSFDSVLCCKQLDLAMFPTQVHYGYIDIDDSAATWNDQ